MIPSVMIPHRTASAIEPAARTLLMARMCNPCPPTVASPLPLMPSVVPKIDASMSCTATALPASSAPTKPLPMNHTMSLRAREWTSAGPVTQTGYPPRSRSSISSRAMAAYSIGFSRDTSLVMNLNSPLASSARKAVACT